MTPRELETCIAAKKKENMSDHDRLLIIHTHIETLVGTDFKEGKCDKRGREISFLKKIAYIAIGGGSVIVFLIQQGIL